MIDKSYELGASGFADALKQRFSEVELLIMGLLDSYSTYSYKNLDELLFRI